MSHRSRILRVLADLPAPVRGTGQPGLSRNVLEGLARTKEEKREAVALINYMIAKREIVRYGKKRWTRYGLPRKAA